jgi:hypothetical protein
MRTAHFLATAQRVVVISYRRFGTTYRSHRQGSRIQEILLYVLPNDEAVMLTYAVYSVLVLTERFSLQPQVLP